MKTHTDEPLSDGTRARNRKGSLSRKGVRRSGIGAAALSIVMLLSSCMSQDAPKWTPVKNLSTGDAVIAVRLSTGTSVSGLQKPLSDNVIALVDAQGQVEAARIGEWNRGRVLWTERGISYGTRDIDYLTTDEGAQEFAHQGFPFAEEGRFALPDGGIAVVTSPLSTGYAVDIIQPDGRVDRRETSGTEGYLGQCGSRILELTNTKRSEDIASVAYEAYAAQSGGGNYPEALDVLVQLDDPEGSLPRVLAVVPLVDGLSPGEGGMACERDVMTVPSKQLYDPDAVSDGSLDATRGAFVLQRWDLVTGERTIIPVVDEDGNAIELDRDHGMHASQGLPGEQDRRFLGDDGRVWSLDLVSGRAKHLFSIPWNASDGNASVQLNETGIYLLEVNERDYHVTLTYYPWDGGDKREVFTTDKLAEYIKTNNIFSGHRRGVQSFAVRPGWNGGAQ
ncbi:MAG: hypothetical protein KH413_04000 [Actinomyces sp.]|nr:hypothetical protein [Actinomyces sp.]